MIQILKNAMQVFVPIPTHSAHSLPDLRDLHARQSHLPGEQEKERRHGGEAQPPRRTLKGSTASPAEDSPTVERVCPSLKQLQRSLAPYPAATIKKILIQIFCF